MGDLDSVSPLHPFAVSSLSLDSGSPILRLSDSPVFRIGMGEGIVAKEPCIISSVGIGSCVVVTLYDTQQCIGGMAHIMLPFALKKETGKRGMGEAGKRRTGEWGKRRNGATDDFDSVSPLLPFAASPLSLNAASPILRFTASPFPCQYADTAVASILKELIGAGASLKNIVAKMAGGAKMFDHEEPDTENIGMENVRSVKKILSKEKIPLICEDVGGGHGRSVAFYLESGRLVVSAIDRENMEI